MGKFYLWAGLILTALGCVAAWLVFPPILRRVDPQPPTPPAPHTYTMSLDIDPTCGSTGSNTAPRGCDKPKNDPNHPGYSLFRVMLSPGGPTTKVIEGHCPPVRSVIAQSINFEAIGGTGVCTGSFNGDTLIHMDITYEK